VDGDSTPLQQRRDLARELDDSDPLDPDLFGDAWDACLPLNHLLTLRLYSPLLQVLYF